MRRSEPGSPETLHRKLLDLLERFETRIHDEDIREKVQSLVPVYHALRDLGSSLVTGTAAVSAKDRILLYLRRYPGTPISGDELMVVAGIGEWARRVRELRVQFGWAIQSGVMLGEMRSEGEIGDEEGVGKLRPNEYILSNPIQDREAAHRWNLANTTRKQTGSVKSRILAFLRANVGRPVTGEELRYVGRDKSEWARRVRELRTEEGWPVSTRANGRPDLDVGVYLLEEDRQSPPHDRRIPDPIRRSVLVRDGHQCRSCDWSHAMWNPSDARHLELHHVLDHAKGGDNREDNLIILCTVCHDDIHRG